MARFLFAVWPFPGHVHPNVAIAQALARRGHEVAFYTGASVASVIEGEGFRCFPLTRVDEATSTRMVQTLDSMSLGWRGVSVRRELFRKWLLGTADAQLEDLTPIVSNWRPDLIVCDPAMWGPLLVFQETTRVPLAVMSYFAACMLPGPEGPIFGLSLSKSRGLVGRAARTVLSSIAHAFSADVRRDADALRRRHGLAPMGTGVTAFCGRVPLYLVPSSATYDRSRSDLPPSVRYVGPCSWDKPDDSTSPGWIRELSKDRPVVYVTEGTMHSKEPLLLRAALKALSSLPVQVIVTTGRHRDPDALGLGPIPSNARVERFVPHSDLLPRTDVIVTTGGTGTVLAALSAGIPLVVVPTAWDQPENALRVAEAGAGIRIAARRCTPDSIRHAVDRLLADSSYRQNARTLGAELRAQGGAAQAAQLLETVACPTTGVGEAAPTERLRSVG